MTARDLAAFDAHVVTADEYEDIPELTEGDFARGTISVGGKPARRGRPAPNGAKMQVTLRLDPAVIDGFKADGPGWQARMNTALREWLAARR